MSTGDSPPDMPLERLADDAWLLRLDGDTDALARNRQVHAIAAQLREQRMSGIVDIVPAYDTLAVFFDATSVDANDAATWMQRCAALASSDAHDFDGRLLEIPVHYGGENGPDLASAAAQLGIPPAKLVQRHTAREYTVAMIGFAAGFPYLLGLDEGIALPRLSTPRTRVPAGSVAIGGTQTGIYPRESPGGWRLLGRTPLTLFDPMASQPSLLQPGDRLRFVPLSMDVACN